MQPLDSPFLQKITDYFFTTITFLCVVIRTCLCCESFSSSSNMDYIVYFLTILIYLTNVHSISHQTRAISNAEYNSGREASPDKIRWEIGLRESTYQALRRENIHLPNLKNEIYSAPILGYQEGSVPFGDIAILARGQLYNTPNGWKFVQDPYRNDCDDCHNEDIRCGRATPCTPYKDQNSKSLMALWTVKRIRHRDSKFGHRYEIQFTVSPMSPAASAPFVTRNGNFDYNIPGHVFVIKIKNQTQGSGSTRDRGDYGRGEKFDKKTTPKPTRNYYSQGGNSAEFIPNIYNINTGEYYTGNTRPKLPDTDPNHTGYLIGISNDYKPQETESQERPHVSKYQNTHEKVQNAPIKTFHHHFYIPEVSDIDLDSKKVTQIPQATIKLQSSDAQKFYLGTRRPSTPNFFYAEAPDSDGSPKVTKVLQKTTPSDLQNYYSSSSRPHTQKVPSFYYSEVPEGDSPKVTRVPQKTTSSDLRTYYSSSSRPHTQKIPKEYAFQNYKETPIPIPVLFHPSTNFQTIPTLSTIPNNVQTIFKLIPITIPNPTRPTDFNPSPYFIKFSDPDPTYPNSQPPTIEGYITTNPSKNVFLVPEKYQTIPENYQTITDKFQEGSDKYQTIPDKFQTGSDKYQTIPDKFQTVSNNYQTVPDRAVTILGTKTTYLVPEIATKSPEITTPSIRLKYPDSINAQLPPPKKGTDTTIPYISSTYVSIIPKSENGNTKIQLSTPVYETTTPEEEDGTTHFLGTTPITTIQKPSESSEETVESTTPAQIDITTLRSSTTRRYLNRKRPNSYTIDDVDIFGKPSTTTKKLETTTNSYSQEELITISSETFSPSSSTESSNSKLLRLNKYLKNRNRNYSTRPSRNFTSKRLRNRNITKEPDVETKTSQSLITSISFQVNKKKNYPDFSRPAILPASTEHPRSYLHKENSEEVSTELQDFESTNKAFNDLAQTLVNHARAVTYLEKTTTPVYTTTNSH